MAGSADSLRHQELQGRPAAGHRLRRPGFSGHRGDCQPLAHEERAAAAGLLHADGSGFCADLLRERQAAGCGTIFRNPDLAKAFRLIQQQGRDALYKGDIGRAIVAKSQALGGPMTLEDLANYKGEWVTPASTTYHGEFTVYGTRAPSQAWGIVEALNVLEACVPTWYPGQTLASLGPAQAQLLACACRGEEDRLSRRLWLQRGSERGERAD
jgi:gamma-glutamyltranspeptidase